MESELNQRVPKECIRGKFSKSIEIYDEAKKETDSTKVIDGIRRGEVC